MSSVIQLCVLFILAVSSVHAGVRRHANLYQLSQLQQQQQQTFESADNEQAVQTFYFTQPVDHFNEQDNRTWSQRYYINTELETPGQQTPIFVYIGGEGALSSRSITAGEIYLNAKLHNATLVGVEHRYYGESQVLDSLTTDNLQWLTSQQALADLANILSYLTIQRNWANRKIFTWGGSYPGALSAWFRLKYPHITVGSVASSAPVKTKADFWEYDTVVSASLGTTCATKIHNATTMIEQVFFPNRTSKADEMKALFTCEDVENDISFLYVLADAVAYAVQYSKTINGTAYSGLCEIMEQSDDLVNNYATFVKMLFRDKLGNTTCLDFSTSVGTLNYTTYDPNAAGRQWYYQSCNEFGYFQTAPHAPNFSLRSTYIDVKFHLELCKAVFGIDMSPHYNFTNDYYGSDQPAGTNIIFVNGNIDPWHALGVTAPLLYNPTEIPIFINGTSHCADLSSPTTNDLASLTQARTIITNIISQWLNQDEVQACPHYMTVCDGRCVDIQNDPHHCGSCGNDISGSNHYCSAGQSVDNHSTIGHELIIIGGVTTLIGIIALVISIHTLRKAKKLKQSQGLLASD